MLSQVYNVDDVATCNNYKNKQTYITMIDMVKIQEQTVAEKL